MDRKKESINTVDSDEWNELSEAKQLRRRAEEDAKLLSNRIALLKQEEAKAWKKIEETRKRAKEIEETRQRNLEEKKRREEAARLKAEEEKTRKEEYKQKKLQQSKIKSQQKQGILVRNRYEAEALRQAIRACKAGAHTRHWQRSSAGSSFFRPPEGCERR